MIIVENAPALLLLLNILFHCFLLTISPQTSINMTQGTTDVKQAKAAEIAKDIKNGQALNGSDENPVQVSTEDLKLGKEEDEAELREKTAHVGRIASNVTAKAAEAVDETKREIPSSKCSDTNPVQVATEDLKVGKEEDEAELREKTAHVGSIASDATTKISS